MQGRRPEPDTVRRALRWYLLWNMVAFVGVAVGALVLSWLVARNEALRDAEVAAKAIAHSIVAPLANDDFHEGDPAALARMGQVMENRSRDGSIAHIKVWGDAGNGNGTVLWSDLDPLIGQTFELEEEEYAVFGTDDTVSDISDLREGREQAGARGRPADRGLHGNAATPPAHRCSSRSTSPRERFHGDARAGSARSSRCRSSR